MARWQCRKKAAKARMMYRRGVTPKEEVKAGQVQYRNDQAEQRALDELKAKVESEERPKKSKIKAKPDKSKKKVAKPGKADEHTKDFFEKEED